MEAWILDNNYKTLSVVDVFNSFIWTERYNRYGDFELYLPALSVPSLEDFKRNNYIALGEPNAVKLTKTFMIIEDFKLETDAETGVWLTVTGRSLKSILDRRVIIEETKFKGKLQDCIKKLVEDAIINPKNERRKIPNFVFIESSDEAITKHEVDTSFYGDNLYDAVCVLCESKGLGWDVYPDEETGGFKMELIYGVDRSYDQDIRPYVAFNPGFENIFSSNFYNSIAGYKTCAIIEGADKKVEETDDDGNAWEVTYEGPVVEVDIDGRLVGLDRREIFLDGASISWEKEVENDESDEDTVETELMTDEEYQDLLCEKGLETLTDYGEVSAFEGEIDATVQFIYNKDFFLGDIVSVRNELGMEARSRITEVVLCQDTETGFTVVPTFSPMEEDDYVRYNWLNNSDFTKWYEVLGSEVTNNLSGTSGKLLFSDTVAGQGQWFLAPSGAYITLDAKGLKIGLGDYNPSRSYIDFVTPIGTEELAGRTFTLSVLSTTDLSYATYTFPEKVEDYAGKTQYFPTSFNDGYVWFAENSVYGSPFLTVGIDMRNTSKDTTFVAAKLEENSIQTLAYKDGNGRWRRF